MYPVLFQIGQFSLSSLWLFVSIAIVAWSFLFARYALRNRLHIDFIHHSSLGLFFGTLLLARAVFIVKNYSLYFPLHGFKGFINIIGIWDRGLSLWGAIAGFVIILYLQARKKGELFSSWLDIFVLASIPSALLLNIGAFLDGIGYGRATDLPWGIHFQSAVVRFAVPIHPTQLYAFILTGVTAAFLAMLYRKVKIKYPGFIAEVGIGLMATARFIEEFFRGDDVLLLAGIRSPQILSLLIAGAMGRLLYKRMQKNPSLAGLLPKRIQRLL